MFVFWPIIKNQTMSKSYEAVILFTTSVVSVLVSVTVYIKVEHAVKISQQIGPGTKTQQAYIT